MAKLKATEPQRIWRIECEPGEEVQVDFGLGAPLVGPDGKARRTWLFRAILSHSRKQAGAGIKRRSPASESA